MDFLILNDYRPENNRSFRFISVGTDNPVKKGCRLPKKFQGRQT